MQPVSERKVRAIGYMDDIAKQGDARFRGRPNRGTRTRKQRCPCSVQRTSRHILLFMTLPRAQVRYRPAHCASTPLSAFSTSLSALSALTLSLLAPAPATPNPTASGAGESPCPCPDPEPVGVGLAEVEPEAEAEAEEGIFHCPNGTLPLPSIVLPELALRLLILGSCTTTIGSVSDESPDRTERTDRRLSGRSAMPVPVTVTVVVVALVPAALLLVLLLLPPPNENAPPPIPAPAAPPAPAYRPVNRLLLPPPTPSNRVVEKPAGIAGESSDSACVGNPPMPMPVPAPVPAPPPDPVPNDRAPEPEPPPPPIEPMAEREKEAEPVRPCLPPMPVPVPVPGSGGGPMLLLPLPPPPFEPELARLGAAEGNVHPAPPRPLFMLPALIC